MDDESIEDSYDWLEAYPGCPKNEEELEWIGVVKGDKLW
jgi:hypothetical protein